MDRQPERTGGHTGHAAVLIRMVSVPERMLADCSKAVNKKTLTWTKRNQLLALVAAGGSVCADSGKRAKAISPCLAETFEDARSRAICLRPGEPRFGPAKQRAESSGAGVARKTMQARVCNAISKG